MSSTYDTYYEFDGSSSCESCSSYSGIYTEFPSRPHVNCVCDIYEVIFEDDYDSSGGDITVEVISKSNSMTMYTENGYYEETFYNHTDNTASFAHQKQFSIAADSYGITEEIEEYFDISDDLDTLECDHTWVENGVEPGESVTFSVNVTFVTKDYELELAYVNASTGDILDTKRFAATICTAVDSEEVHE